MKFDELIESLKHLDTSIKEQVKSTANIGLTIRNWLVGAYIVEFEQNGEERAKYGDRLILKIAESNQIKGLNERTLEICRQFYQSYSEISQTLSAESLPSFLPISQTLSAKLEIPPTAPYTSSSRPEFAAPVDKLISSLSFSHFVELLRVEDLLKRSFYEIECIKGGWSVRELKRQIGSLLYERLGLSTDKEKLLRIVQEAPKNQQAIDIIKDPYVFEFLGLQPKEVFRENDLETALLDKLQDFLLELGSGFCFEDRQKKIRIGNADYFVDLVFYHRKLHCHVIIELKVEPFNHSNAGQLNTYLNYYKKHELQAGDNPPIGLLLCTHKDHALVEYALGGIDKNLFVSTYQVALPNEATLKAFLEKKGKEL